MGPRCQPHKRRIMWFPGLFFTVWFLSTRLLTFDYFPLINVERHCWLMGPRCQPHYTRNSWYLDYFVPVILQATYLSFSIPSIKHRTRMWAPKVSLWVQEFLISWLFFTRDIAFFYHFRWTFWLLNKVEARCRMWVQHVMLSYYAVAMKNTKR